AYDALRIVSPESEQHPVPSAGETALTLPPATTVEYFLRIPPLHPVLRVSSDAGAGARLQVMVQTDGSAEETVLTATTPANADVDLARYADRIVRLRFTASGDERVELRQPELIGARRAPIAASRPAWAKPPNVILYLVDTLRADHLGCYGYQRPTS